MLARQWCVIAVVPVEGSVPTSRREQFCMTRRESTFEPVVDDTHPVATSDPKPRKPEVYRANFLGIRYPPSDRPGKSVRSPVKTQAVLNRRV